jgi:hypothetical protein
LAKGVALADSACHISCHAIECRASYVSVCCRTAYPAPDSLERLPTERPCSRRLIRRQSIKRNQSNK